MSTGTVGTVRSDRIRPDRVRPAPTLIGVSTVAAAVILGPLLGGGHLLYRDAVSTPRSYVTDTALGVDGLPPRAVPQDWFVALASHLVGGGATVVAALALSLVAAGVGAGLLAAVLVPSAGRTGAVAAALIAIWNPFVAERLLQGHWGLLAGYAALPWIVLAVWGIAAPDVAAPDVGAWRSVCRWVRLGGLLAVAGLTPSGSVLALVITVSALAVAASTSRSRLIGALGGAVLWLVSALPWLVATAVGGASIGGDGAAGVRAFGLRSEPLLGPLGTALGLGGIWNADAAPASRTMWWAAVATLCLVLVVVVGAVAWWRKPPADNGTRRLGVAIGVIGVVAVAVAASTATPPGRWVLAGVIDAVPGAGLLRDTTKLLALAVPAMAVAGAAATGALRRRVPSGFALAVVGLLVVAPLPDLAWGVGGRIEPVHYPAEWSAVADAVPAGSGDVAPWPTGTVRHYPFDPQPSLDPSPRMLRTDVVSSGELRVDGRAVDPPTAHAVAVADALNGDDPAALTRLGVGWVLVQALPADGGPPTPPVLGDRPVPVLGQGMLRLYRLPGTVTATDSSSASRAASWAAHAVWLALICAGVVAVGVNAAARLRSRSSNTARNPSQVADQE